MIHWIIFLEWVTILLVTYCYNVILFIYKNRKNVFFYQPINIFIKLNIAERTINKHATDAQMISKKV